MHDKSSMTHWWLVAVFGILLLLMSQVWLVQNSKQRTKDIRTALSETQSVALQLTQTLGYGGLIHHFKNLVLRPDRPEYQQDTLDNAEMSLRLLDTLESDAAELGVVADLHNVRSMIRTYTSRVDEVIAMHEQGRAIKEIDDTVQFNDEFALRQIRDLISSLKLAVVASVDQIERRSSLLSTTTVIASVLFGGLAIGSLLKQRQRRERLGLEQSLNLQLEASNASLTKANESLKQFAGIVSHDLRAPIRHINTFNELVMEDYEDRTLVEEHVGRIRKATRRMHLMIDRLLEFTRAGYAEPKLDSVDVAELVNGVLEQMQVTIDDSSADIQLDLEGQIMADHELMQRVLHNLIGNSIKYRDPQNKPRICISSKREQNDIRFCFSDNGIGIDPRFAERIFKPFERLHDQQSKFEGSGIGLALVKSVIDAHKGKVWLDLDYTGGSRFEFTLRAA